MTTFADRIEVAASKIGGITELSRRTGVSKTVLHKYKRGESDPSRERLDLIAEAAGVSVQWLATGKEQTYSETFAQRLNEVADKMGGIDGMAEKTGLHKMNLEDWLDGLRTPQASAVLTIADAAGVTLEWLMTGEETKNPTQGDFSSVTMIPLLDVEASAGGGSVVYDDGPNAGIPVINDILVRDFGLEPKDAFAIITNGESMEPTLKSGDPLVCSRSEHHLKLSDGVYVLRMDGDIFVKRLQKIPGGSIEIISDNQAYRPITLESDKMKAGDIDFQLLGRVMCVYAARRL